MDLKVKILKTKTEITLPVNKGSLIITKGKNQSIPTNGIALYLNDGKLAGIQTPPTKVQRTILIMPAWDLESDYLFRSFAEAASENGLNLKQGSDVKIPGSQLKVVQDFRELIMAILGGLGFDLFGTPKKKFKGKPRHRWTKAVSQIAFKVDHDGSHATVYWQKRNEMLIKAGAVMKPQPELNKDGSLGFSARFAEQLRSEHTDAVENSVTTKDIVLKSVNEVGLFLYFGGTNSWRR
ncbi:hypothetical protein [Lentilactobacillus kisonensis]|uniref:Uncharacterized protein n=1 Tax=Lentilactobacillus kisonensis F0435 TaxID=797516 RepID=H1LIC3_9LACO|nr:hypothetical protein [Lentilactobacillus kisonensis]EHO49876.1 hypothetical protein HMPREF9104_02364 [Lentilactobacillus kisonensis F0435]